MYNMIELAKQLIDKGNNLEDPELVAMGMSMLEKYKRPEDFELDDLLPEEEIEIPAAKVVEQIKQYVCSNCGTIIPYDKDGRKKCPECKKLALKIVEPIKKSSKIITSDTTHRATADDFHTQIRQKVPRSRIRYNDNGEVEGTYARTEQVEGITNVWQDERVEGFDEENEKLKALTKHSPRMRPPAKMIQVVCDECKTVHMEHPLHAGGRARYVCNKCIKRRSRV